MGILARQGDLRHVGLMLKVAGIVLNVTPICVPEMLEQTLRI